MINQQIVAAYETKDENMSFEEFCAAWPHFDPEAIKMVLASGSVKYRQLIKNDEDSFTDHDYELAKQIMVQNLTHERFSQRAAEFIINEKKGRHDIKQLQNMNINIINIDERMKRAKEAIDRAKSIDITETQPAPA